MFKYFESIKNEFLVESILDKFLNSNPFLLPSYLLSCHLALGCCCCSLLQQSLSGDGRQQPTTPIPSLSSLTHSCRLISSSFFSFFRSLSSFPLTIFLVLFFFLFPLGRPSQLSSLLFLSFPSIFLSVSSSLPFYFFLPPDLFPHSRFFSAFLSQSP